MFFPFAAGVDTGICPTLLTPLLFLNPWSQELFPAILVLMRCSLTLGALTEPVNPRDQRTSDLSTTFTIPGHVSVTKTDGTDQPAVSLPITLFIEHNGFFFVDPLVSGD